MISIKKFYYFIQEKYWTIYGNIAPIQATKEKYKKVVGKECQLDNPTSFTEKLQWLKLNVYSKNSEVKKCVDKYLVREYVKKKGCSEILNELYGVWDSVEAIPWEELPRKFVLKCNHGCGFNIICNDFETFDVENAKQTLSRWLKKEYGGPNVELIYKGIKPLIICEKFIETESNGPLIDYKIFCNYGKPRLIYVITGGHGEEECLDYYTTDWQWIPVNNGTLPNSKSLCPKPATLDKMLQYASILSADFPIVRVDLYSEFGQIIFGELTFLATGGLSKYSPSEYDKKFGELFKINTKIN